MKCCWAGGRYRRTDGCRGGRWVLPVSRLGGHVAERCSPLGQRNKPISKERQATSIEVEDELIDINIVATSHLSEVFADMSCCGVRCLTSAASLQ